MKTTIQQEEAAYNAFMGVPSCAKMQLTLQDLEAEIAECTAMVQHFIDLADKEETKFWRRMLQSAKNKRRELLTA